MCAEPELSRCVHEQNQNHNSLSFASADQNSTSIFNKNRPKIRKLAVHFPPSLCLKKPQALSALLARPE
jgi:hypothetical protein